MGNLKADDGFRFLPIPFPKQLQENRALERACHWNADFRRCPFGANGWRLAARDLSQALAYAPKNFVGVMEATVDLRAANDVLLDSRFIRLEWLPKQFDEPRRAARLDRDDPGPPAAAPPSLDAEELATLIRCDQEYLRTGDIAAARRVLWRAANAANAANAGNPQAAFTWKGWGATPHRLLTGGILRPAGSLQGRGLKFHRVPSAANLVRRGK